MSNLNNLRGGFGDSAFAALPFSSRSLSVEILATATITLDGVEISSTASLDIVAEAGITLSNLGISSDVSLPIQATSETTLGTVTLTSAGLVENVGTLNLTLDDIGFSASADLVISSSATNTLGSMTSLSSVIVTTGLGGFYRPTVLPTVDEDKGLGFWNTSPKNGEGSFYGTITKTSGSGGGFYNG